MKNWLKSAIVAIGIGLAAYLGEYFLALPWYYALIVVTIILMLIPGDIVDSFF